MDIFENLEELNVSEECFGDIVSMVEAILSEGTNTLRILDRAYDKTVSGEGESKNNKRRAEILNRLMSESPSGDYDDSPLGKRAAKVQDSKSYEVNKSPRGFYDLGTNTSTPAFSFGVETEDDVKRQSEKSKKRHERK